MINEIKITSVDQLIEHLNKMPNHFIYRGQSNANWGLQSSLERIIDKKWSADEARRFEEYSLSQFKSKFHLYDHENSKPDSKLAWLSIMQHYGVPTRLIDFTESPYVALYFAMEFYNPLSHDDFSIYAIDYTAVMENSLKLIAAVDSSFKEDRMSISSKSDLVFEKIVDRFSYDIAWIAEPQQLNARLDRQAGSFLLSGNRGMKIEDILNSVSYENSTLMKLTIANTLYESVFSLLRKMNITSKSLYGDLDGLARSIRMQMQVYSV